MSLIVGRSSPEERLEELLNGTALTDPKQREALLDAALLGQLDCKVDRFLELLCQLNETLAPVKKTETELKDKLDRLADKRSDLLSLMPTLLDYTGQNRSGLRLTFGRVMPSLRLQS